MTLILAKFSVELPLFVLSYETVFVELKSENMLLPLPPATFLFQEHPPYNQSYLKYKWIVGLTKATKRLRITGYLQSCQGLLPNQRVYHKYKGLLLPKEPL